MSDTLADLASWLPSDFLTDDDFPLLLNNHNPHLLPYDFASSSSTESESDDDDIAGLTRRYSRSVSLQERLMITFPFEKKRGFSGSPESTLNMPVSAPTKCYSSPTTPFAQADEHAWDLFYTAAGEVARIKMRMNNVRDDVFANRGLLVAPRPLGPPIHQHHHPNCAIRRSGNEEFIRQQQFRQRGAGGANYRGGGGRPVGPRQPPWPPLPVDNQRRQQLSNVVLAKTALGVSGGTAVVKRECAGTGVFLPRRYCNDTHESKKKPACSPAYLPARVAQSFTKNMDPIMAQPQPPIHGGFIPHYEIAMARRNTAMLAQQRRSATCVGVVTETPMGHPEVVLPQEWTY